MIPQKLYEALFAQIKDRIVSARISAARGASEMNVVVELSLKAKSCGVERRCSRNKKRRLGAAPE